MPCDHERLDVYQVALDFIVVTNDVLEQLPRGRSHLAKKQLERVASMLIKLAKSLQGDERERERER